jgi:predicted enzyme related to lactoylglutathione lyase
MSHGKICYVHLPSRNVGESSAFYQQVFGWSVRQRGDGRLAFDDGVGSVSGAWITGVEPAPEKGMLFYIMVDDAEATIKEIVSHGGKIIRSVGSDAPEITAYFSDPTGNIWGIYQEPVK